GEGRLRGSGGRGGGEGGLGRLDVDRLPYLESQGRRQERRDAQDRAPDHVAARPLGDAAGDRLADSLARQRRSLVHHRGDARCRWRPFYYVTALFCAARIPASVSPAIENGICTSVRRWALSLN